MAAMTRLSTRTDRRRGGIAVPALPVPAALGWVLALLAVFLCCSPAAGASASDAHTPSASVTRAITPTPAAAASVVTADAPDRHGSGSSCHGASDHSTAVVLPGPAAPMALPCARVASPAGPLTGAAAIRGPSNNSAGAVDHLRLQVQRV